MKGILVEKKQGWRACWPEDLPQELLRKGLRLSLPNPRPAVKGKKGEDPDEKVICEVLDWSLEWGGETELVVEVHEVRKPWFSKLSQDKQGPLVTMSVVLTLFAVAALFAAIEFYPQPVAFWSFVGHYIRGVVGWGLVGLGFALSFRVGGDGRQSTFLQHYLNFLMVMLGVIAAFVWSQAALRPAGMSGSPEQDIRYLDYLMSRARTVWPLVAGTLPWFALGLEALGFGIVSKITSALGKRAGNSGK
jgi:hypothetical protein